MSNKLVNLDAQQLRALLSTLVGMGVNDIDADQTLTTLVDDNDTEEQDVELEFIYKGRPSVVWVKACITHNATPVFSVSSDDAEITQALTAVV